jgi:hypothetical protein
MSKRRAAAVLGVLVLTGLLFLSGLAVAGGGPRFKDPYLGYFTKLQGAFRHACWERAKSDDLLSGEPRLFLDACLFIVRALKPLTPIQVLNITTAEDELREAFLDAFAKDTPGLRRRSTCDECVEAVSDLEAFLATNGTSLDIEAALSEGCDDRFFYHLQKAAECRRLIGRLPQLIDFALADLPPVTVCQELKFCPAP